MKTKDLATRMSHRLANYQLDDKVIASLADRVLLDGVQIARFDVCMYGICVDYFTDKRPTLEMLDHDRGVVRWEVFPYGIIDWDRFRVRVAYAVDELEAKVPMRGFGR